jgi:hypothetical protein
MMRLCDKHIHELSHALSKKGMAHLCSLSDAQAKERGEKWLLGTAKWHEFDPLVVSVFEICKKAVDLFGQQRVANGCPLCKLPRITRIVGIADSWIDNVTDQMLVLALANGLLKRNGHKLEMTYEPCQDPPPPPPL